MPVVFGSAFVFPQRQPKWKKAGSNAKTKCWDHSCSDFPAQLGCFSLLVSVTSSDNDIRNRLGL